MNSRRPQATVVLYRTALLGILSFIAFQLYALRVGTIRAEVRGSVDIDSTVKVDVDTPVRVDVDNVAPIPVSIE